MVLHCCFTGTTLHSLKLAAIPYFSRTLTSRLTPYYPRPLFPLAVRSLSAASSAATSTDEYQVVKPQWKAAIDFKWIRDNKESVAVNIKNRNSNANLEIVLELYEKLLSVQKEVEKLRAERNAVANKMKGKLEPSERQKLIEEGKNLKEELVTLEEDLLKLTDELQQEAQSIPNMTHPDVPLGGENSSTVRKMVGKPAEFSFAVKDHVQLGKELDLFDFDAAAEVSGSKFYYLKNEAVILEMGLVNWAVSEAMKRGFTPLTTPEIVRSSVVEKCGFQPRGTNTQVYSIENSDQCLIGTAEIPVGGIHMDSILSESSLPLKYVAFSHCFRTEAGAAGAATRFLVISYLPVILFFSCLPFLKNTFFLHIIYDDICYKEIIHIHVLQLSYLNYGVSYYYLL
uniref:Seryl-tRNA synthetase n=1 Tax=Solanum tuberosum TaxID=4113 RepID=M1D1D3_SOLTU